MLFAYTAICVGCAKYGVFCMRVKPAAAVALSRLAGADATIVKPCHKPSLFTSPFRVCASYAATAPAGTLTLVRAVVLVNAAVPTVGGVELSMVRLDNWLHSPKAASPILVTELGMVSEPSKPLHL